MKFLERDMLYKLRVPFGSKDARLYEPKDVLNGKACGCICPACKAPLIAKQSAQTPHFAHAPGASCEYGLETAIHLAAKQIISDRMEVRIPAIKFYSPYADGQTKTVSAERLVHLDNVDLEVWLTDMRPDIVVKYGQETCLVEIAVTHFADQIKKEKIRQKGIQAFEIDVRSLESTFTFESLTNLLYSARYPATWLHNKHIEKLALEDAARHSKAEAAKVEAHRERVAALQAKKLHDSRIRAEKFANYKALPTPRKLEINLRSLGLTSSQMDLFSIWVPWADSFSAPYKVWQSAVLVHIARLKSSGLISYGSSALVNTSICVSELRWAFEITTKVMNGDTIAVAKYLRHLEDMGILNHQSHNNYALVVTPDKWPRLKLSARV